MIEKKRKCENQGFLYIALDLKHGLGIEIHSFLMRARGSAAIYRRHSLYVTYRYFAGHA